MLKLMEIALLVMTLAIILGLVVVGQPEAPPVEEHPVGAREPVEDTSIRRRAEAVRAEPKKLRER